MDGRHDTISRAETAPVWPWAVPETGHRQAIRLAADTSRRHVATTHRSSAPVLQTSGTHARTHARADAHSVGLEQDYGQASSTYDVGTLPTMPPLSTSVQPSAAGPISTTCSPSLMLTSPASLAW